MRRADGIAFAFALALHIAITTVWYSTLPHAPPAASTLIPLGAGYFYVVFVNMLIAPV